MHLVSRRRVLSSVVGLAVGLSGCSGSDVESTPTATVTERGYAESVNDPSARRLRNDDGDPAVRSSAVNPVDGWVPVHWAANSERTVDTLEFAPGTVGVEEMTAFLDDFDFSRETALVHQYSVGACSTRRLERLQWGKSADELDGAYRIRLDYEVTERDADCRSDGADDVETTVVRVPADVERVISFTSSW